LKKLIAALQRGEATYRGDFEETCKNFFKFAERRMKENAPVRTGKLRDSIRILSYQKKQAGDQQIITASIGPTAPYADFVETGTKSSPGRFIYWPGHGNPPFGVRRKKEPRGRHPGTPKQPFVQKTADELNQVQLPGMTKRISVIIERRWDDMGKQSEGV
jgi:HK97 gp10 family phage protein